MLRSAALSLSLVAAFAPAAFPQAMDAAPKLGFVFSGAPGVLWNVADNVAIKTDVSYSQSRSGPVNNWTISPGLGARFYMGAGDALRVYAGPRFIYSHPRSTPAPPNSSSIVSYTGDALVGAQYALHRRLSLFGEAGMSYRESHISASRVPPLTGTATAVTRTWGTTSAVGLVFWFGRR